MSFRRGYARYYDACDCLTLAVQIAKIEMIIEILRQKQKKKATTTTNPLHIPFF